MTGFVYKWTNQITGEWYIGSRKGTINDGYRHSSKPLALAEKKYGLENFTRKILFEGDYEKDKIRSVIEARYLHKEHAASNPMSYNQTNITKPDSGLQHTEETKKKIGDSLRGRTKSDETKRRMSIGMMGNTRGKGNLGNTQTKEHREKHSKSKQGIQHTAESNKKRSIALKGHTQKIIICPHCKKSGGNVMQLHHFDNCKQKEL